jgi:hypothetical protein
MARHGRLRRLRRLEGLDPVRDFHEIYRATVTLEFPWDMKQALSFALFRTYAVPGIGELLARTGEFTQRTQKRYDDTALILDAVIEHGFGTEQARDSFRRMNQMHGAYPISNDDMRYVLSTFVVSPAGWPPTAGGRWQASRSRVGDVLRAVAQHEHPRGARTAVGFEQLMVDVQRERFAFSPGGRAVADATLNLLGTFPPFHLLPARLVRPVAYALMDDPLLAAFRFPRPSPALRTTLRARPTSAGARRPGPSRWRNSDIRSYPDGGRSAPSRRRAARRAGRRRSRMAAVAQAPGRASTHGGPPAARASARLAAGPGSGSALARRGDAQRGRAGRPGVLR